MIKVFPVDSYWLKLCFSLNNRDFVLKRGHNDFLGDSNTKIDKKEENLVRDYGLRLFIQFRKEQQFHIELAKFCFLTIFPYK